MRRHDRDAGGSAELLAAKGKLRERVWKKLERPGVSRFPRPRGRIPNFVGAEAAAERLRETAAWRSARTIKSNPDSPQLPVRERALADGKVVYMAVPRLAEEKPFFLLDPATLKTGARAAASIKGASRYGRRVDMEDLSPVDLVVTGCVAVGLDGRRLGKGGGFSDLELAIAAEAGLIGPRTRIVTTVHDAQVLPAGAIPQSEHDFTLDLIVTPTRVIRPPRSRRRPRLFWDELTEEKIAAIPLLQRLRSQRTD
jgi:5-formyltetrahydrofolate cyclo-ligase